MIGKKMLVPSFRPPMHWIPSPFIGWPVQAVRAVVERDIAKLADHGLATLPAQRFTSSSPDKPA